MLPILVADPVALVSLRFRFDDPICYHRARTLVSVNRRDDGALRKNFIRLQRFMPLLSRFANLR